MKLYPYKPPQWSWDLLSQPKYRLYLSQTPTPIHKWDLQCVPKDFEIWIKRDDQSGCLLSGNKVRKLEFLLADALLNNHDCVITCGGIQSNHCRATAVAARQNGLDAHLFLRTKTPNSSICLEGNLLLDHFMGAEIRYIDHDQYNERRLLMEKLAEELKQAGKNPYIIPEGGSNALGTWGYMEAVREMNLQMAEEGIHFDDIVFACGSGGTAAGLALGGALCRWQTRVHTFNVCDTAEFFYDHIDHLFSDLGAPFQANDILNIIDGYQGMGYAVSREEELVLLRDVARSTGILLDSVYSGKAFYGFVKELKENPGQFQGKKILFLHTGGLFGLYSLLEQLEPLFATQ